MKTVLYIVRHTQTVGNIEKRLTGRHDYEITEEGKKYIKKMEEALQNIKFESAYSSTSGRTIKTIQNLANKNGIKIKQLEELCEMDFGIYDGMKWEDVDKINPEIKKNKKIYHQIIGIPKQETTEQVEKRMKECIIKIAEKNDKKTILICSHGCAIFTFLNSIEYIENPEKREKYSQSNACINELEYENGKFKILKINQTSHIKQREIAK